MAAKKITCAEIEILLADYVDGALHGDDKSSVDSHLSSCTGCAELARDIQGAVAFLERTAVIQPPPELVNRILFEVTSGPSHAAVKPSLARRLFGKMLGNLLEPVLQPRFAMGMAMTVLSFAMLGRFAGIEVQHIKPSDLDPVKVWTATEDKVNRAWTRTVKYYDSLRLVFEIQSRLNEWTDEQPNGAGAAPKQAAPGETK